MAAGNRWRIAGPLELLVLQPTPFCNLDCTYCYLPDRDSKRRMSDATLNRVFQFVFSSGIVEQGFTVVWHAGEPMVLPVAYYERAIEIAGAHNPGGVQVRHSFQTNGVLIDDAWCDFFKRHHVNVGVSIDGPAFLPRSQSKNAQRRRDSASGDGRHPKTAKQRGAVPRDLRAHRRITRLRRRAVRFLRRERDSGGCVQYRGDRRTACRVDARRRGRREIASGVSSADFSIWSRATTWPSACASSTRWFR